MDFFALPRTTFTFYLKLVQFPFEVGMRLLGGGEDDAVEATADRADSDQQARRSSKPSRQRAPKSGHRAPSRRGQRGDRQQQARRRDQAQRETAARQREARQDASARDETAAEEVQERIESARQVQEGIEAARGAAAASQRDAAERETTEPVTQDDAGTEDVQGRINAASERAIETAAGEMADDVQERIEAARNVREGVEAVQSSAAASQREAPEPVNTGAENVQERIQAVRERATDTAAGGIPEPGEAEDVHERFPLRAPGMSS